MPFMEIAVMTVSLPVQEMILFGVVLVMTPLPVQLEPTPLILDQVMTPLTFPL